MDKNSFMFYPEITDNDFYEKIYEKKEFRDYEIKKQIDYNKISEKKEFTLDPHQLFLKNYISPDTPYNGILIFHQTGVGKTCTAISIAEGFKKTLKNMNKKILVLTHLKDNFLKELYDYEKERTKKNPEDIVQCTGKSYDLGEESIYLTKQQKEREIYKLKKSYYQFFGYRKFAYYISKNTGNWKGDEDQINDKIKKFISKEFDGRVIIIDEIQNIKTDQRKEFRIVQQILQPIIKYSKNIKLILMSATPMFDRPDEIIFYINLLLQNDGRELLNKNEIFNTMDGTLKSGSEKKLKDAFKGYISYVRGEKPFLFPFRIYPKNAIIPNYSYYISGKKIETSKKIKYTKIILCEMENIQQNTYLYYLTKKIKDTVNDNEEIEEDEEDEKKNMGILHDLIKISNITFPILESNQNIGSFNKTSYDYDNGQGGYYKVTNIIGTKKKIQYRYQSHAIFNKDTINEIPFADEKYLHHYSTKFSSILETIKKTKGLVFIFSRFIEMGTLPLSLILEQNGFDRECIEGENSLLDYHANKFKKGGKRKQICYLCSKEASYYEHHDEKCKNYHIFKRAKYILCIGENSDISKITKDEALRKFNNEKNKYGEEIKIIIGTKVISEGLDFKRIRQIHILEPWYNLSRHEQIIGRGIRYKSHVDLLPEEQNVEIYQYAAILKKNKNKLGLRESVDLKNYRLAENKDIIIKDINRIMKESAIDCVLFRNGNIIDDHRKVKQITASGMVLNLTFSDKPNSPICDYKENCNYICEWMPNPRKKYPINTDTYNISFSSNDIENIKKDIKSMFRQNIVYYLKTIEDYILNKNQDIDQLFIYVALEQIVNNKNEIVYDKFGRKGYIIYRGDYYIFQPFDLERDDLPLIYRMNPTSIPPENVDLENIELNYINNEKKDIKNKFNEKIIIKNIDETYQLHIEIINNKHDKNNIYKMAVIGCIFDRLNENNEINFIQYILKEYLEKSKEDYINNIIEYLNLKNKLINFYRDILYDKLKIKENIFVGFIVNNNYYILENIIKYKNIKKIDKNIYFITCPKEIIAKIKSYRELTKSNNIKKINNTIYGIIEFNKKKYSKVFKIIDKSLEEEILTKDKKKSKRSIITGRICSTFQLNKLLEIREKIGMYKLNQKRKIEFICEDIEIYFRYKKLLNDDNKIWLEEDIEN